MSDDYAVGDLGVVRDSVSGQTNNYEAFHDAFTNTLPTGPPGRGDVSDGPKRYTPRRTQDVEAMQFTGSNFAEIEAWLGVGTVSLQSREGLPRVLLETFDGVECAYRGMWIVRSTDHLPEYPGQARRWVEDDIPEASTFLSRWRPVEEGES